jgi:hypothetical protein
MDHPARHALVELVNLHDEGLEFEAIHRVAFGGGCRIICWRWRRFAWRRIQSVTVQDSPLGRWRGRPGGPRKIPANTSSPLPAAVVMACTGLDRPRLTLPVASLQAFLDDYLTQPARRPA